MHKFIEKHWLPLLVIGAALLISAPPKADARGISEAEREAQEAEAAKVIMPIMCDTYIANQISVTRCFDADTNLACYSIGDDGTTCAPVQRDYLNKLYNARKANGELNTTYEDERPPK
ncbi:hypothetical protein LU11_gp317 [Pseudomonas phage Lu11]|uniref:hypothetical protein n=1 Tax=Pseudomonas phage Lu11 TaxID=1161927 RepID=UPI00025F1867|nr:hypothetical protein LU11_gp317 [Pseudomonas phage Lu11]AFH14848.1 hypothetical protein Lu11_0310 [Pseudomonas phage Lu11]